MGWRAKTWGVEAGPEEIATAIARLRSGGLVAFPTETVYGLGADALDAAAVERVFEVKGRPANNPLIVHVSGAEMASQVAAQWPPGAQKLARAFWPGPLSIVVPRADHVPLNVTAGGEGVAVRCPDHPLTLALIEALGRPVVGPSANPSGRVSPTTAQHVRDAFSEEQVYVLDGGACRGGIESTVVDLTGAAPRVLRPGLITPAQIAQVLGQSVQGREESAGKAGTQSLPSPGLLAQHYAPSAKAVLVEARDLAGLPAGAAGITIEPMTIPGGQTLPADPRGYAAGLYSALRRADSGNPTAIWIQRPAIPAVEPERSLWLAIMDRLSRATAGPAP